MNEEGELRKDKEDSLLSMVEPCMCQVGVIRHVIRHVTRDKECLTTLFHLQQRQSHGRASILYRIVTTRRCCTIVRRSRGSATVILLYVYVKIIGCECF